VPERINNIFVVLICISTTLLFQNKIKGQTSFDSLDINAPKHYYKTVIFLDSYSKPNQQISDKGGMGTDSTISKKLKSYGIQQFNFGFYTPIHTHEEFNFDSTVCKNTHYLLTGNALLLQPKFDGIQTHNLLKLGVGLRIIHNSGKKGVWFIDISPFVTKDVTFGDKNGYLRMANSFIYSYNATYNFNFRIGLTKSFLWGNRNYLPYLGLRFGRLDKVNFSIQIPKSISLNIPINNALRFSVFSKPQGGMFTFSNYDSLYNNAFSLFSKNSKAFHFTRYEILTGFRLDAVLTNNLSCYASLGLSSQNNITFYSEEANAERPRRFLPLKTYFYEKNLKTTGFLNFGLVVRFGQTKSYYNNKNLYDAFDLNNVNTVGDNNSGPGNIEIPIKKTIKRSKLNLVDIQDLIDTNDN